MEPVVAISADATLSRRSHAGERAFTLIELLVSMVILTVIGTSIGGAFAVGFHVLGTHGDQVTLTGNHDLIAFEQQLGADIARAQCLAATGTPPPGYGQQPIPRNNSSGATGCQSTVYATPTTCHSGYLLCLAWYSPAFSVCHIVTYREGAGSILRFDSVAGTTQRISTGDLHVAAGWSTTPTAQGNTWTNLVAVEVDQLGIAGIAPSKLATTTFRVVPLSDDPLARLPGATPQC
jgi:prepilin-type N-terminal cleavage/methylation domain-containing protein